MLGVDIELKGNVMSRVMFIVCVLFAFMVMESFAKGDDMDKAIVGPRKVVVGTAMQGYYGKWDGLDSRLEVLGELIDDMALECERKYPGKSLDLVVLTEEAVTGGMKGDAAARSIELEGQVLEFFAGKAKQYKTYIVVTLDLIDDAQKGLYSNAAALVDRGGKLVGVYRKVHSVAGFDSEELEGGMTPGDEHKVFDCDFGKLGIQICFDIGFDAGWEKLKEKGAELVAWPTMSPQVFGPAVRASEFDYWIVSSTWRNNASVLEPTGLVAAQITDGQLVLVHELDLSYLRLPWSPILRGGEALKEKYGDGVGYHYSHAEDGGLFWSNDEGVSIGEMAKSLGLENTLGNVERNKALQDKVRGGDAK